MDIKDINIDETKVKVENLINDYTEKAKELLKEERKVDKLLQAAEKEFDKIPVVGGAMSEVTTLIAMVKAYMTKEYSNVPIRTILLAMAALIYLAQPMDLIPDFIPVAGYLDDALGIAFVVKSIGADLNKFKKWQVKNGIREVEVKKEEKAK